MLRLCFFIISILGTSNVNAQVNLESLSGISKDGIYYYVTGDVLITQSINPIPLGIIRIYNGGRLRFGNNASIKLGEVKRDSGGQIVYDNDLKPVIKSSVYVLEQHDAGAFGADNYNGSSQARFMNGCNVELEGVTWVIATTSRSDFDIKPGASVHFRNSFVISKTFSYSHFASSNITIDGLVMDHRSNTAGLEFGLGNIPSSLTNLDIIDNNTGSGSRHFVLVNFPGNNTYEIDRLKARNICLYSSSLYTTILNNPLGNVIKGQFYNNILEVNRDLSLQTIDDDNNPLTNVDVYVKRKIGDAFTNSTAVNANGSYTKRLLQYRQTHGSSSVSYQNEYDVYFAHYNKLFKAQSFTLDYEEGLNGENDLGNIKLLDDDGISENNMTTVSSYTGISINHASKTITISDSTSLCNLYDYIKYDKVSINQDQPNVTTFLASKNGTTLNLSDYSIEVVANGELTVCDLFEKIETTGNSTISDISQLQVALQDQTNTYKLIRLKGLENGHVMVYDHIQDTLITSYEEQTGEFTFVTNGNYTEIKLLIEKDQYTDWGHVLDLSVNDVFSYIVFHAPKDFLSATEEKQEEMIYILQKLLLKTQAIQSELNNNTLPTPTFTINNYNTGIQATIENQVEMTRILKLLLKQNTSIRKQVN